MRPRAWRTRPSSPSRLPARLPSPPPSAHRRRPGSRSRRIDGADVAAKRRKTSAGDDPIGEEDVSLERYEYAAPSAILSGDGACGFAITCAFNREKSATKEALELIRPHLPELPDVAPRRLRLNPVKTPGRGFIFMRLSPRPSPNAAEPTSPRKPPPAPPPPSPPVASAALPAVVARGTPCAPANAAPGWVEKSFPYR